MDAEQRRILITDLHTEMVNSTYMALRMSRAWQKRSAALKVKFGDDTAELHLAKRDDLRLKEYMAGYNWHAANAGFASGVIATLMNQEVQRVVVG